MPDLLHHHHPDVECIQYMDSQKGNKTINVHQDNASATQSINQSTNQTMHQQSLKHNDR